MSGSKSTPAGTSARMRFRYAVASAALMTGGVRFGMTMARLAQRAMSGTVVLRAGPSLRWICQSSGAVSVSESIAAATNKTRAV